MRNEEREKGHSHRSSPSPAHSASLPATPPHPTLPFSIFELHCNISFSTCLVVRKIEDMVGLRTLMRLLLTLATIPFAETRFRHYKWEVKYEYKSPDCYKKLMITINGRSPGPTIVAQQNDTIIVEVKNSLLTENVAIHLHGIRQIGTPWFDGLEGVTHCPIVPGDTFVYKYVVDRPGTFLYHAHYGMQRVAGLYGLIRVALPDGESEPFSYNYDRSIILQDWYHKSTYEQATGLSSIPFGWVGEPQSLLIQGRGRFDCSTPGIEAGLCNAQIPNALPILRISSLTGLSALSFEIEGHNMTVVATDGHYVEAFVVKNLFIYSGVTYSVLIKTDQDPSRNYWASSTVVSRDRTTSNGLAIFNYYPNHPRKPRPRSHPLALPGTIRPLGWLKALRSRLDKVTFTLLPRHRTE
ncbi:hypothetical protein HYC85_003109 [Camellia sinensis]|uniref:Plastocyanin-like domain-containing protein n=1 Tax=Camellia sinensis TaxID=4442 RepID=A0A7J7IAA6_CAMSI|nr:hypothetical protein HYC85_003109 [Camellia sinensis]